MSLGHWSALCTLAVLFVIPFCECALPNDLSNYQNEYACDSKVRLVRPLTISDVQAAIATHTHVVPVGTGFSWNREFFCASPPPAKRETAANIVMTTIRPLTIDVSEDEMSAWVSAAVTIWDLMVYLANYITPSSPRGYALAAPPSFVNQTIAGAIATNTHGSSLKHGSLSNQAIGFKVVLANGTHVEICPESHPLFFKAFQVSVGRLGVVTDVKLKIVPEKLVRRRFSPGIPAEEFLSELRLAQTSYRSTGKLPSSFDQDRLVILSLIDFSFMTVTLETIEEKTSFGKTKLPVNKTSDDLDISQPFLEGIEVKINSALALDRREKGSAVADGVKWKMPSSLKITEGMEKVADLPEYFKSSAEYFEQALENVSLETHEASFTFSEEAAAADVLTLQDGYEVALPVDKMADCLQGIVSFLKTEKPDNGFRLFPTLKIVGKEEGLLSASNNGPVMWFGLQDLVYYNQKPRSINEPFRRFMGYLVTNQACSPVGLHWGGAGWPSSGCWNGVDVYKDTWCDFGCAVRALDPDDKFIGSAPDRWNWEGANLESCCTKDGYNHSKKNCDCKVPRTRHSVDCPPAPFYTDR